MNRNLIVVSPLWFLVVALVLAAGLMAAAQAQEVVSVRSEKLELRLETVASGLEHPWGMAFLPDGRVLVTERPGRLRIVATDGSLSAPLDGVPPVAAGGQGGLLDVTLHPGFADNGLVYLSYSEPGEGGNSTAVARGRLDGNALREVEVIFRQQPKFDSSAHFGSRLVFARDGTLFVTLGERYKRRDDAQTLDNHHGKVVRIND